MKIDPIHQAIADNYLANGGNKTQAYLSVRPKAKPTTAKVKACNLFKRPEIISYLEEQSKEITVNSIASRDYLIRQAHRIGNKAEEVGKLNTALTAIETKGKLNNVYDRESDNPADYSKLIQALVVQGDVNINVTKDKTIDITPGN
jgi:phage terminase small subunit